MVWRRLFSITGAATLFAIYYAGLTCWTMHRVIYPLQHVPEELMAETIQPLWRNNDSVDLGVWVVRKPNACPQRGAKCVGAGECHKIVEETIVISDDMVTSREVVVGGSNLPALLWRRVSSPEADGDWYLTFCATNKDRDGTSQVSSLRWVTHGPVPRYVTLRWLLQDYGLGHLSGVSSFREPHDAPAVVGSEAKLIKRDVVARLVISDDRIPVRAWIPTLHPFLVGGPEGSGTYLPPFFSAAQNLNKDGYHVMNATHAQLGVHMKLGLESSDLARWLLLNHFDETKKLAKKIGLDDRQMDETLDGFANTSVLLLTVTLLATVLHCLFEFFAFRSDVAFWQKNESLRGLSVRALFVDLLFQIVILLYLVDEETSFIVLGFSAIAIFIQLWKIRKATAFTLKLSYPFYAMQRLENEGAKTDDPIIQATLETDKTVMNYIVYGLIPTAVAMSVYSLLFSMHQGWWSWLVSSLAAVTYTAGFLLMTPQVIINYKLKSVEHLPWEMLTYRFINTFIDDLFACIVALPTMHRLSVFRDDVIFIICVVQRIKYGADKSRKEHQD